jgi:hypothetical protein
MSNLIKRRDATQQTLRHFNGVDFDWDGVTCAHLAHYHLSQMGREVPDIPDFDTALSAARALKQMGWDSVEEMLDSMLERIAPAYMIVGDLALIKGAGGLDAIFICAGPLKVFGWREDAPDLVRLDVDLGQLQGAWRI